MTAKPIPDGYHSLTSYLIVDGAAAALDFYKKAFGAEEVCRMPGPGGKVMHAEMKVGDSIIMVGEEALDRGAKSPQTLGGSGVTLMVYLPNVDQAFDKAIKAGCTAKMPPSDMFWGDRYGQLTDPYGHCWALATHIEDVAPQEMEKRMAAMFAKTS